MGLKWSAGPPAEPGMVGRPTRRAGSGREALQKSREWSGGLSLRTRSGRVTFLVDQECLEAFLEGR